MHPAVNIALEAGAFVAQFAPVPALGPILGLVQNILEICDTVEFNKQEFRHLEQRCRRFLLALGEKDEQSAGANMSEVINGCIEHMKDVLDILTKFLSYSFLKAFSRQDKISDGIKRCHQKIDDCCTYFEIKSHYELHQWKETFETFMREDRLELQQQLLEINKNVLDTRKDVLELFNRNSQDLQQIKRLLQVDQEELNRSPPDSAQRLALQQSVYRISKHYGVLPPNLDLKSGEVQRIGLHAVGGNRVFDIYEGRWLDRDKVALKAIREARGSSEKWEKFKKEAQIWQDVGSLDGGRHILPFYGVFLDDGQVPCMVSPWMENGNVMQYLEKNPTVSRLNLIKGIANCLRFLHNFKPNPIVHGDIKANIFITDSGQPLLADFGLSQVLANVNGVPVAQSTGLTESFRWTAPELCTSPGILSVYADVYSYAMTIVQIMTGEYPFSHIRRNPEVLLKMLRGERPRQPTDEEVLHRGLDDHLWSIICDCWKAEPQQRPTIDDVLARLG